MTQIRTPGIGTQALALAAASGGAQVLVAVAYLLAARNSDPSEFGGVAAAIALGVTAAGLIDFGTNSLWIREVAAARLSRDELSSRATAKVLIAGLLSGTFIVCAILTLPAGVWLAGPIALGAVIAQTCQVPLRASARGDLVAIAILCDKIAVLAVYLFLSFVLGQSVLVALWVAVLAGALVSASVSLVIAPRHSRFTRGIRVRTNPWSRAHFFGFSGIAISLQSLDLPILLAFGGQSAAGAYGAVNRWTQPLQLMSTSFSSVTIPYAARHTQILPVLAAARRAWWMPVAAVVASVAVCAFAHPIVNVLLGPAYASAAPALQFLAIGAGMSALAQPLVVILQSQGRERHIASLLVSSVLLQLGLIVLLGGSLGALAAGIGSLVAQACILLGTLAIAILTREGTHD